MWLLYLATVYLFVDTLATQVSYDPVDISSSSSAKQEQLYSWPIQHSISNNNSNVSFQPSIFDYNVKRINQLHSNSNTHLFNSSFAKTIIDDILSSNQQKRNLKNYDQVYTDPEIKNALQHENDTIARSFIRNKLCSLGLMNCVNTEERSPYYNSYQSIHPQDVIYAQPVTIKPVGRPLQAIPLKGSGNVIKQQPNFVSNLEYLESTSPLHSKPIFHTSAFIAQPSTSFIGSNSGFKKNTMVHNYKPVYEPGFKEEIDYENKFIDKKQLVVQTDSKIQQHIHHHFHHNDQNEELITLDEPRPVNNNAFINYGYGINLHNNYEDYRKNLKNKNISSILTADFISNNYANQYPSYEKLKPDFVFGDININRRLKYDKLFNSELRPFNGFINKIKNVDIKSNNEFSDNDSNNNFGFNNEFTQDNAASNGLLGTNYNDCTCVHYDECIVNYTGRKDDLYLAIDPRNLRKNIESDNGKINATDGNDIINSIRIVQSVEKIEQLKNIRNDEKNIPNFSNITENKVYENNNIKSFESKRIKRNIINKLNNDKEQKIGIQSYEPKRFSTCGPQQICCKSHQLYQGNTPFLNNLCGIRYNEGIAGRIKTPTYTDGDSEFGEYPWQVAILKKVQEEKESIYICGGTLISPRHIITAAHCIKTYSGRDLRVRLGEWDVNHDVEFFPYIERNIVSIIIHPEFYAGTLYNDISILKLDYDIDFDKNPHISPACLPNKFDDFIDTRCWTTGWGKDAFGDFGKYQNILKEVDVPIINNNICEHQMRKTRLGSTFNLHPGFICAGGEEGKDACKGDGGGPMVCEHQGKWQIVGIVSWGIGCGQAGIPGIYTRVSYYIDWIKKIMKN